MSNSLIAPPHYSRTHHHMDSGRHCSIRFLRIQSDVVRRGPILIRFGSIWVRSRLTRFDSSLIWSCSAFRYTQVDVVSTFISSSVVFQQLLPFRPFSRGLTGRNKSYVTKLLQTRSRVLASNKQRTVYGCISCWFVYIFNVNIRCCFTDLFFLQELDMSTSLVMYVVAMALLEFDGTALNAMTTTSARNVTWMTSTTCIMSLFAMIRQLPYSRLLKTWKNLDWFCVFWTAVAWGTIEQWVSWRLIGGTFLLVEAETSFWISLVRMEGVGRDRLEPTGFVTIGYQAGIQERKYAS